MSRMLAVAFLGLPLTVVATSDDSKSKIDPKPQWQRLLTDADARKAADLEKRIGELEAADKYAETIRLIEELLALRTRLQGADHWETVNQKWELAAVKKVAALPEEKRAGWRQASQGAVAAERLEHKAQYPKALALRVQHLKWCREVLGEEHPHTATSCNNLAMNLNEQGKYADAAPLLQKALDIRKRLLGEDHPDTATSYNDVAYNLDDQGKYVRALPLLQKGLKIRRRILGEDHLDTATSYNNVAYNLDAQSRYAEAQPFHQKALDIRRKILSDDHPAMAESYNNVAYNLEKQAHFAEARPLYQKALDIRRKVLKEDHPLTALSYNNLAMNLQAMGMYVEAGPLLQKALDIRRKIRGEEDPETARSYNNVALNLSDQGKYAEAGELLQKALDIRRKIHGENADTALCYNNVASNLHAQGKDAEALLFAQKALDISRKVLGENDPLTATSYNGVAFILNAQGKYAEAGPLYQKALEIQRKVWGEDHPRTAVIYNNVAMNLHAQRKYAQAAPLFQKALQIARKFLGEYHTQTAGSYANMAYNLQAQKKYAEALPFLEAAARAFEAARLSAAAKGLERAAFGAEHSPYPFLAAVRHRAGRATDAWAALEADLARGLLDEMALRGATNRLSPAEQRQRDKLHARRSPLENSILALVSKLERTDAEMEELERLIAQRRELEKSLAALAVAVSRRELAPLAQIQAALPVDAAFVAWVDFDHGSGSVQEHYGCVVRPQGEARWEPLPGSGPDGKWTREDTDLPTRFHNALAQSASANEIAALAKKLHAQRLAPLSKHLIGVKRLFVAPVNQMAGIPIEALSDQYTVSYTPSGTYLARLKDRPQPKSSGLLAVGDPVFPPPSKDKPPPTTLPPGGLLLVQVIPGGPAAKKGLRAGDVLVAYSGEDLTSVEQLGKLIAARAAEKAVVVKVWREGQDKLAERELPGGKLGVLVAKEPARQAIIARRQADQLLAQLHRGESYAELPGTQVEIARLAELFDAKAVTILSREKASEKRLDEFRRAGTLKQFRYLHLATHGKANNVSAFESALILTRPKQLPEVRVGEPYLDGRLTAGEVLEYWKLDSELVTLSACESGLGRRGGGDGLLGFAQSFLMAGSRSVCLTLWQVDDTATVLLMDRFYHNLLGKGAGGKVLGKAAALREAKQWLRNVKAGEALERLGTLTKGVVRGERPAREEMRAVPQPKNAGQDHRPYAHPRYWAAFILIGDPE